MIVGVKLPFLPTSPATGAAAYSRVQVASTRNVAKVAAEGFVPVQTAAAQGADGGVKVRLLRGEGSPEGLEAMLSMSSPIDLVEEGSARVGAARTYRANARLSGDRGDDGVRVRMDRDGDAGSESGDGDRDRGSSERSA
jgi:hypothetical protein